MKLSRGLIAIIFGIIVVGGWYVSRRMQAEPATEEAITDALDTDVIDAGQIPTASQIVRVAGYDVRLNPDPRQVIVLASSQPQITNPTPSPFTTTDANIVVVATPTPLAVPTAIPTLNVVNPTPIPNRNDIAFVQHTVQQGETLYGIASRYGTSVSLMAEYSIAQDHIYPGNVVNVPVAAATACAAGQRTHVVLEGDNVFRIAIVYGTTKEAIRAANPVINENYLIYAGDVICIP